MLNSGARAPERVTSAASSQSRVTWRDSAQFTSMLKFIMKDIMDLNAITRQEKTLLPV